MRGTQVCSVIFLAVCAFVQTGCGKSNQQKQIYNDLVSLSSDRASQPNIRFATSVSSDHVDLLSKDFDFLTSINITDGNDSELRSVMKLRDSSPQSLVNWLNDRFQYLVPKEYEVEKNAWLGALSGAVSSSAEGDDSGTSTVMAANVGASVYIYAKRQGKAATMNIPGLGEVAISSPRVGVIQEGDGLFRDMIGEGHLDDVPHILMRLGTLFHEARHSDGNGNFLCFAHAECPSGDYEGLYACDDNGNGPYKVEAELLKAFADSCTGCSTRTQELFKLMELDNFSRLISDDVWDDAPEGSR